MPKHKRLLFCGFRGQRKSLSRSNETNTRCGSADKSRDPPNSSLETWHVQFTSLRNAHCKSCQLCVPHRWLQFQPDNSRQVCSGKGSLCKLSFPLSSCQEHTACILRVKKCILSPVRKQKQSIWLKFIYSHAISVKY